MTRWTIMGVVNATPDSFSDGGRFERPDRAAERAAHLAAAGATIIDIGGESTRPGAEPVAEDEEIARVVPAIEAARARLDPHVRISVDTMKPAVARAAATAGAVMWNDVTALRRAPESLETAAALGVDVVLMHMAGEARTLWKAPRYGDVVDEVRAFLEARLAAAVAAGVREDRILLDPGIGFGKTTEDNLALIRGLDRIVALGRPVLFGPSRKRFIAAVSRHEPADERDPGTIAACLEARDRGVSHFRVHDAGALAQALRVRDAIRGVVPAGEGR